MNTPRPTALALAGVVLAVVLAACESKDRAPDPALRVELLLEAVRTEMEAGRPERAADVLERGAVLAPRHPALLLLEAAFASMYWDDERALTVLLRLRSLGPEPVLSTARLEGRIGEIMVRSGDHARAGLPLRLSTEVAPDARADGPAVADATPSADHARRAALAALIERLPGNRHEPQTLTTELPLIGGVFPRLFCRFGEGNASIEVPFVLDTGATFTTVDADVAARLGVETVDPPLTVTDGRGRPVEARFGVLPAMSLGGTFEIDPRPVLVVDRALLPAVGDAPSAKAVVGIDLLRRYRVTLDPSRSTARFELPRGQPLPDSVQCLLWEGRVMVPVECEGTRLWFVLDTGASNSSLTPAGVAALPGGAGRARDTLQRAAGPGGAGTVVREVAGLILRIANLRVTAPPLPVVERAGAGWFPVHGVLGSDILSGCTVTFDEGRLRLEAR